MGPTDVRVVREAGQEKACSIRLNAGVHKAQTQASLVCGAGGEQRSDTSQGGGAGRQVQQGSCGEHAKMWVHRGSHCENSESHSDLQFLYDASLI